MIRRGLIVAAALMLALTSVAAAQDHEGDVWVTAVTSGNTFDVEFSDGEPQIVRLLGVNAPRIDAADIGTECYGLEARDFLSGLITGTMVRLEREVTNLNPQGRLLRHVWVWDAETESEYLLSALLVAAGTTEAQAVEPDTMMAETLAAIEEEARSLGHGRWGAC